jgi:outer membrane protein TolC
MPYAALNVEEPVRDISLQDAIERTVKHSLAIKVDAYNPAIKQAQVVEAEAIFDPVFFGQTQWASNDDPQLSPTFSNGTSWNNQIGIRKLLPTGGTAQASVGANFHDIDVPAGTVSPDLKSSYANNINIQLTQPLLQGFGTQVNEANIYLAQRDLRITLSEFKQNSMKAVADVEEAYLDLILARTNVEVLERLVVASQQTYNDIVARQFIDATKASINQALSALDSRRADLHVAQKTLRNASDRLKSLLNDPEIDVAGNVLLNPSDRPITEPVLYTAADCIAIALQQRPEMIQARLQLERADIVVTVAKNGLLPKVDLTLSMQSNGLDRGFDQSLENTVNPMNALDFAAGIKFEIPLGNRAAEAQLARHESERRQAIENLVQIAQKVIPDVKQQLREVLSDYQEIAIRDAVRQEAAEEFQGIIEIEDVRPRTPEFLQLKLDSQANLAQAEQALTQAVVNYNLAIMRLEQSKGTLLEFNRISLDHPPTASESISRLRILGKTMDPKPITLSMPSK